MFRIAIVLCSLLVFQHSAQAAAPFHGVSSAVKSDRTFPKAAKGIKVAGDYWRVEEFQSKPLQLQKRLTELGFYSGLVDGYPGPETRNALMLFQVKNCLIPTGQPSPMTALALATATRGNQPCPFEQIPKGISANTPLFSGIYVSNPKFCGAMAFRPAQAPDVIRIVHGRNITFGYDGGCTIRRTDIDGNKTLFKGSCINGDEEFKTSWHLNILGPRKFIEITGYYEGSEGVPFELCPENSKLRQEYSSWFN